MTSEVSPTARALLTLELLQNHPGITADRIADRLGVTSRAVRRYMEILREADIPIHSVRGPSGGYRLGRGNRPAPLRFNASEALGLVMAVLDGHHSPEDSDDPVGSALSKLLAALPEGVATQANAVRRQARMTTDRSAARPSPDVTVALTHASAEHRLVRLNYRSEAGSEWTVEAEPWAVVVRYSRWYLLCRSLRANEVRTYRVDRIQSIEVLDGTFEPPAGLDAAAVLEEKLAVGWEFDVDIVIDAPLEAVARCIPPSIGSLTALEDGRTRLTGSTSNPRWYASCLVELPGRFEVRGGEKMRDAIRELGELMTAAVAGDDANEPPATVRE